MSLNFYRRVTFGLSPNEKPDKDPLNWAINQLDTIPDLLWPGTRINTDLDLPTPLHDLRSLQQTLFRT